MLSKKWNSEHLLSEEDHGMWSKAPEQFLHGPLELKAAFENVLDDKELKLGKTKNFCSEIENHTVHLVADLEPSSTSHGLPQQIVDVQTCSTSYQVLHLEGPAVWVQGSLRAWRPLETLDNSWNLTLNFHYCSGGSCDMISYEKVLNCQNFLKM